MAITIDIQLEEENRDVAPWQDNPWQEGYLFEDDLDVAEENRDVAPWVDDPWQEGYLFEDDLDVAEENRDVAPFIDGVFSADAYTYDFDAAPDPQSDPYVLEVDLDPQPGATNVNASTAAFIPVGDAISTLETPSVVVPYSGDIDPPPSIGIDPTHTTIWVQYDSDPPVAVFSNGVVTPGWSVVLQDTDQSGTYRSISGVGKNITVIPTSGIWPYGTQITITLELVDYANNDALYSYSFETQEAPPPVYPDRIPEEGEHYLISFDFPLRFKSNCDIVRCYDEKALNDDVKLSVFIRKYGIPLFPLGVGVEEFCFEPMDIPTQAALSMHLRDGVDLGVDGLKVNGDITFVEHPTQNKLSIAVPYLNTRIGKNQQSVISAPKTKVY
jgi:hypothetical protein